MIALGLLVAVLLLALNAFFVAAEFAAVSVRRAQIEHLADGNRRAQHVLRAQRRLSMLLAGAQFGITLCSLGLGAVAEPSVARVLEHLLHRVHLPGALAHPVAFAIALTVVVTLHMVLGEMVPKNIALARPEGSAVALVPTLDRFVTGTKPVITALNGIANGCLRLARIEPRDELKTAYDPAEFAQILTESHDEGLLADSEHGRLHRTLALNALTAGDVAVPATKVVSVDGDASAEQVQALTARTGISRFPVRGDGGAPTGYVHVLDTVAVDHRAGLLARDLPRIPASTPLADALVALRRGRSQLALVGTGRQAALLVLDDVVAVLIDERAVPPRTTNEGGT